MSDYNKFDHVVIQLDEWGKGVVSINGHPLLSSQSVSIEAFAGMPTTVHIRLIASVEAVVLAGDSKLRSSLIFVQGASEALTSQQWTQARHDAMQDRKGQAMPQEQEPFAGYNELSEAALIERAPTLTDDERIAAIEYEAAHKNREAVLKALGATPKTPTAQG